MKEEMKETSRRAKAKERKYLVFLGETQQKAKTNKLYICILVM